jgi:hypothetical protein
LIEAGKYGKLLRSLGASEMDLQLPYTDFSRELPKVLSKDFGLRFDRESVNVGLRGLTAHDDGFVRKNDDKFNEYNDRLWTIYSGGKSWNSWRVTCDPGRIAAENEAKYLNAGGEGRVISSFKNKKIYRHKIGLHNGKIALVQSGEIWVLRDKNKDHIWNESDKVDRAHGVDIHASGGKKKLVELSSVACTAFYSGWNDSEWKSFIQVLMAEAEKYPKSWLGFPYIVYDQEEVFDRIYGIAA